MKKRKHWKMRREPPNVWNNKFQISRWFRLYVIGPASIPRAMFRVAAAKQICGIIIGIMIVSYGVAAIYNKSGDFNVSIDRPMENAGFLLSDEPEFQQGLVTLKGNALENVTNINICDIDSNVTAVNGSHNGKNYIAYTFYLKNGSSEENHYEYEVRIRHATKNADAALWVMVYENDEMRLYAKANPNGSPECQYSSHEFPFLENAVDKDYMQSTITKEERGNLTEDIINYHGFTDLNGIYQLKTLPFSSDNVICRRTGIDIAENEVHKYTVVAWLEGEDPDCVNDILGGTIDLVVQFSYIKE